MNQTDDERACSDGRRNPCGRAKCPLPGAKSSPTAMCKWQSRYLQEFGCLLFLILSTLFGTQHNRRANRSHVTLGLLVAIYSSESYFVRSLLRRRIPSHSPVSRLHRRWVLTRTQSTLEIFLARPTTCPGKLSDEELCLILPGQCAEIPLKYPVVKALL